MTKQNKTTEPEMAKHDHPLMGLYFHTFRDGKIDWQGRIESAQTHGREEL
jgi:hypothetical protein